MLKATIEICDRSDESDRHTTKDPRIPVDQLSTSRNPDCSPFVIKVENFSARGFAFSSRDCDLAAGTKVLVDLDGAGAAKAVIVWRSGHDYGCEFLLPLTRERMAKAFTKARMSDRRITRSGGDVPDPIIDKWPPSVRLALLGAGAVGSWVLLYVLVKHALM